LKKLTIKKINRFQP